MVPCAWICFLGTWTKWVFIMYQSLKSLREGLVRTEAACLQRKLEPNKQSMQNISNKPGHGCLRKLNGCSNEPILLNEHRLSHPRFRLPNHTSAIVSEGSRQDPSRTAQLPLAKMGGPPRSEPFEQRTVDLMRMPAEQGGPGRMEQWL